MLKWALIFAVISLIAGVLGFTGVAAGALTALLGHGLVLLQGRATGQSCLIRTRVEDGAILVGGRAEPNAVVAALTG